MQDGIKIRSRLGDNISGYSVLALAINPKNPDKAVVWYLDCNGEPHTGDYFVNVQSAYHEFVSRAFGWYI